MTPIEKEQQKIFNDQLKKFIKDKQANAKQKAKPMTEERISFKQFMLEAKKPHDDTEEDKELIKKMVKPEALKEEETVVENSPFDWKGKSSIFTKKDEPTTSAQGGTIYKARETARNAETGGEKEKQSVGRPKGEYGSYKIDKAKREDPEYKKKLSQKVMAAKKDNFAIRDEFKKQMHDALLRHQLRLAGHDPKDHEAQIAKKNPVKK